MSRRLRENLSSTYFEAANRMTSKRARRKIVAYVESYDDVLFWRSALSDFEDETRYFEVMLPSKASLTKGKKQVLMNLLYERVGEDMIACVDADYDYLMQGRTPLSDRILSNKYVLHTYVYAIENYQCYAPSLHNVCVMVTLNDHAIFDFVGYLTQYSEIIFPLFAWNIWAYRTGHYGAFTITDFNRIADPGSFSINKPYGGLNNLKRKVNTKLHQLQRLFPWASKGVRDVETDMQRLGITPSTTYLYIQGHHLFDCVVVPMLKSICDVLIRERQTEIYNKAVHTVQKNNELSCYSHSLSEIQQMLKKNLGYVRSTPFMRLRKDIERLFPNNVGIED